MVRERERSEQEWSVCQELETNHAMFRSSLPSFFLPFHPPCLSPFFFKHTGDERTRRHLISGLPRNINLLRYYLLHAKLMGILYLHLLLVGILYFPGWFFHFSLGKGVSWKTAATRRQRGAVLTLDARSLWASG